MESSFLTNEGCLICCMGFESSCCESIQWVNTQVIAVYSYTMGHVCISHTHTFQPDLAVYTGKYLYTVNTHYARCMIHPAAAHNFGSSVEHFHPKPDATSSFSSCLPSYPKLLISHTHLRRLVTSERLKFNCSLLLRADQSRYLETVK